MMRRETTVRDAGYWTELDHQLHRLVHEYRGGCEWCIKELKEKGDE